MYAINEIPKGNILFSISKPDMLINMPNTHYHNHYEIYYLLSGKRKYFIDNQLFNVNKGDIVLIPKGALHQTTILDNSCYQRLLISFNDFMIYPEYENDINQCFNQYLYHIPPALSNQLEMILFKIEKEYKNNDKFSERLIKGYLFELFTFMIRFGDKCSFKQSQTKSDTTIQEAATYISENFEKDIRLHDVAKYCSISEEHLSRKFKKVTGFGFSEYLTLVRIMQAEKLLLSSKLPVTEIAMQCGFNDSNYFSAVFKKAKGISPYKFKKSNSTL